MLAAEEPHLPVQDLLAFYCGKDSTTAMRAHFIEGLGTCGEDKCAEALQMVVETLHAGSVCLLAHRLLDMLKGLQESLYALDQFGDVGKDCGGLYRMEAARIRHSIWENLLKTFGLEEWGSLWKC